MGCEIDKTPLGNEATVDSSKRLEATAGANKAAHARKVKRGTAFGNCTFKWISGFISADVLPVEITASVKCNAANYRTGTDHC